MVNTAAAKVGNSHNPFPADGKVLVIWPEMFDVTLTSRYMNRVYFWHPSQLMRSEDLPGKVAAACVYKHLDKGDDIRVRDILTQRQEVRWVKTEHSLATLRDNLATFMSGIDLSVDPAPAAPKPALQQLRPDSPKGDAGVQKAQAKPKIERVKIKIEGVEVEIEGPVVLIDQKRIARNPEQPREEFDPNEMAELADSILHEGQMDPVVVFRITNDPNHDFMLVDGERRWRSCGTIGKQQMRAIVTQIKDKDDLLERSLMANLNRKGHTPLEMAKSLVRVRDSKRNAHLSAGDKMRKLCRITGWTEAWVRQYLQISDLPPEVSAMLSSKLPPKERLKVSVAAFLTTVARDKSPADRRAFQIEVARDVVRMDLNYHQARHYALRKALEQGMTIGDRARKPVDDWRLLNRFVVGLESDLGHWRDSSTTGFQSMLMRRNDLERSLLLTRLKASAERLRTLIKSVEKVQTPASKQ